MSGKYHYMMADLAQCFCISYRTVNADVRAQDQRHYLNSEVYVLSSMKSWVVGRCVVWGFSCELKSCEKYDALSIIWESKCELQYVLKPWQYLGKVSYSMIGCEIFLPNCSQGASEAGNPTR